MNQDKLPTEAQDTVNDEWRKNFRAFSQEQRNKLHTLRRTERKLIRAAGKMYQHIDTMRRREILEDAKLLGQEAEAVEMVLNVYASK